MSRNCSRKVGTRRGLNHLPLHSRHTTRARPRPSQRIRILLRRFINRVVVFRSGITTVIIIGLAIARGGIPSDTSALDVIQAELAAFECVVNPMTNAGKRGDGDSVGTDVRGGCRAGAIEDECAGCVGVLVLGRRGLKG